MDEPTTTGRDPGGNVAPAPARRMTEGKLERTMTVALSPAEGEHVHEGSPRELGEVATSSAPEPAVGLPAWSLGGVADQAERDRVFEALFQVPVEPQRLGRYVVLGTLGRGGMGTVLEAFDRTLDRRVAVKMLHGGLSEQHRQRLLREAQALAKLSHPNVVQIYEVGEADGQVFIAMELVRGKSLWDWVRQDPRPGWRECVEVYLQAGEGLAAAHLEGLVHRDFKPGNAVIDDKGRVRVLDFGLARQAEDAEQERSARSDPEHVIEPALASSLTQSGTVLGTPAYMPLEQMEGRLADARSDQFAFCVSLYEALYGERPFEGSSMEALLLALYGGKLRPTPKGTTVPEALRKLLLRGLATDPGERWPSMEALLSELRRLASPRRGSLWALGMAGGLAAVGLGLLQYAEVGFRCEGAQAQLYGVWDEARKQQVEDAILATGLSYATDTWARVEPRLDEYARAWADKHTEVCEATSVRQEQSTEVMDLRMECLRGRRLALREAVGVLAAADPVRVEKAAELVASLPGLSRCDDVEALAAELPPPEDPQVAKEVEASRERLAQVRALLEAGVPETALAEAESVVERAEDLSYAPLLAEALLERGTAREHVAQYTKAEADAERAYSLAVEHGHDEVEAIAAGLLVCVVGRRQQRHEPALVWAKPALAAARGRRVEPALEASVLDDIAAVLQGQGKLPEALIHHRRALAINEQALGPHHPNVAKSLESIGVALRRQGELPEALIHHERALAILEQALGPRHPKVGSSLRSIGGLLQNQGRMKEALAHHERGLAILEEALGPHHPDVAKAHNSIGSLLRIQDKLPEALPHHEQALAVLEQTLGPSHPSVGESLNGIGLVLLEQGKLPDALTHLQRGLATFEQALGPSHPSVGESYSNLGRLFHQQGKWEEALAHHQRALAIFEEVFGPRHRDVAKAVSNIGLMLKKQGKLSEALPYYQRSLAILEEVLGPRHPELSFPLMSLAEASLGLQRADAAREYAERAVSILESSEAPPLLLADARCVLARTLESDPAERLRAHALVEQARETYLEIGEPGHKGLTRVQTWLEEHPMAQGARRDSAPR